MREFTRAGHPGTGPPADDRRRRLRGRRDRHRSDALAVHRAGLPARRREPVGLPRRQPPDHRVLRGAGAGTGGEASVRPGHGQATTSPTVMSLVHTHTSGSWIVNSTASLPPSMAKNIWWT